MEKLTLLSGAAGNLSLLAMAGAQPIPFCSAFDDAAKLDFVVEGQTARVRIEPSDGLRPAQAIVMHSGSPRDSVRAIAEAITYAILEGAVTIRSFKVSSLPTLKRSGGRK